MPRSVSEHHPPLPSNCARALNIIWSLQIEQQESNGVQNVDLIPGKRNYSRKDMLFFNMVLGKATK